MENGLINEKNVRESQRRLAHNVACDKLLSLVVLLLNFAKPAVSLTFEQKLKFVMACIIRRWLSDYTSGLSGVIRTILIAWSEDDIDIIEYGNEFDEPILPVGSKLSDVIVDNSELKTELRNVNVQGLSPWGYGNFGAVECELKSTQQKKKGKHPYSGRRIFVEGVLIRGYLLNSHQAGKEMSGARACKRVLQTTNDENSLYTPKRARIQSMEIIKPRSYTAWLSLKSSSLFTGFCTNFSIITGIPVIDAIHRSPMDFLHQEDKCWSQIALALWNMGKWTQPCPYRIKKGNCLHEYIYIQCEIKPLSFDTHHNADLIEIKSTVLSDNGEQMIKDSRKGLTQMLLDLLVSQNSVPKSQQIFIHQELVSSHNPPIATEAVTTVTTVNTSANTYNGDVAFHQQSSEIRPNYQMQEFASIYSPRSDVFSNHNHSQENFINQPIHSYAVTISPCSENSSSPATAMNDSGIGDDQCYDDGLSNSDHCPTSSNFDETNPEFVWLQPLPTTETNHLMSSRSASRR